MNKLLSGIAMLSAVMAVMPLLTGCNVSGSYKDDDKEVDFGRGCCIDLFTYKTDVLVSDTSGFRLAGATVELTVATVPEQRFVGKTDRDGFARFFFDSLPGVTAVAFACAPGYECNASDMGTTSESFDLFINVVLTF